MSREALSVCYGVFFLVVLAASLAPLAGAQSPRPFEPLETGVPDGLGVPLGFGDVNGDGTPDLIVAGAPFVLLNDGHGLFTAAVGSAGSIPPPQRMALADFNQDGRDDLLTQNGNVTVSLWFGTPSGALVASANPLPAVPGNIVSVAAGDITGDGAPEIVFGRIVPRGGLPPALTSQTAVLVNDGVGGFTLAGTSLGLPNIGASAMAFLDVDADGDQDLAVAGGGAGTWTLFDSGGTFSAPPGFFGAINANFAPVILVARLNPDVYPDAVVVQSGTALGLFDGGPAGLAASATTIAGGVSQSIFGAVAVFDLTGDGIDEVLRADDFGIDVYSIVAPGPALLLTRLQRPGGTLLASDFDGDSDRDLLLRVGPIFTEYFSDGAGGLHPQGSGLEPRPLLGGPVAIDLTGDGAPELVGTVFDGSVVKVAIAQNDGTGRFTWTDAPIAGTAAANKTSLIAAADVDGDGQKDLAVIERTVVSSTWSFSVRAIANGGAGVWTAGPASFISTGPRCDVEVADFNGDGKDDLVFCDFSTGVRVLYASAGAFLAPGTSISSTPANRIAVFDADGDLDSDVAVAGEPCWLLTNGGGGSFTQEPGFPFQFGAGNVTAGDVNGDSVPDVYLNTTLYLHLGATWVQVGNIPSGSAVGATYFETRSFDFDLDGDIDTLVASGVAYVDESGGVTSTHSVATGWSIAATTGWTFTPVDLDRDGDLDLLGVLQTSTTPGGNFPQPRPQLVLYNTARHLTQDAPARPGHTLNMGLHGAASGYWYLYAAAAPASIALPPLGTVFMDPASTLQLGAGTLSTGSGAFSFPLPPSASALVGTTFELQSFLDTAAGPRLTNARHVLIVAY